MYPMKSHDFVTILTHFFHHPTRTKIKIMNLQFNIQRNTFQPTVGSKNCYEMLENGIYKFSEMSIDRKITTFPIIP